ncbi:glycosyltransferase [uncultured Oxalicibacterium sp.]|uniref:glycosyltransferase n=1 Tax=uncultured Oxalicibacterium sp. TaxID=1168540 RepID=UPI0025D2C394|nr:glycosyltransferase [uncultured Oxalicibacterium sp.]
MTSKFPLVSIVMPAYKFQFIDKALDSILAQTYPSLELIICDDSADDQIQELIQSKHAGSNVAIRYSKNNRRLGELGSTAQAIKLAQGKYVKFLHDDDVLVPECVTELCAIMEKENDIALASSRRQRIDEDGEPLPDILATNFPFSGDVIINGKELVSFLGDHTINFIGEPSCVMVRRTDLLEIVDTLMSLNGKVIHWVGDLALYAKLLQRGNLAFLSKPLTKFRVSQAQYSQSGRDLPGIGEQGHADFRQAIRDLGWYRTTGSNEFVSVAPITGMAARIFKPINLLTALRNVAGLGGVSLPLWLGARYPKEGQRALIDAHLTNLQGGPRIGILIIDSTGNAAAVERTLRNLEDVNLYRRVDIVVCSVQPSSNLESRAVVIKLDNDKQIAQTLNQCIADLDADWIMLAKAGSEFLPSGLLLTAIDLPTMPEQCVAAYADEIVRVKDTELGLLLRPDFNLDLLLSFPASMSPHWLYRRQTLLEHGGFSTDDGEAFELAYQLQLVEQYGLGCVGHISEPLLTASAIEQTDDDAAQRNVILRHLHARGFADAVLHNPQPGCYAIDYAPSQQPAVSIMIVVRERLAQVQRCLETLLANTDYTNYEILLIDHGNQAIDVRTWLDGIESMNAAQLRVLHFANDLSHARVCNEAAQQARGDFLLWLADGAGVLHKDWLQQLVNHGTRPEVGAVGAKLLSADGKIHHAGFILGLDGPAGRVFEGLAHDDAGYMQRLQLDQNYAALSRECLLLRRELFLQAGGFDEEPLLARCADIDLCLKLQQAGLLNVWTPRATLLMDVSSPTTASVEEEDAMYARWLPVMAHDPAYNPGFSLRDPQGFKLAEPQFAWRPLQAFHPLPTVLAYNADIYGCGHYRVIQPTLAMTEAGLIDGTVSGNLLSPSELARFAPDIVILQRPITDDRIAAMHRMHAFSQAFKVYELDDYLPNLPMKSAHRQDFSRDIMRQLRQGFNLTDRFVVSTQALKEAFDGMHPDIRVIENRLQPVWWKDLQGLRRISAKPRVGWAGGAGHAGDLELIADVVRELANEVEWIFFGMCPDKLRPYIHEFHPGVSIHRYPQALAKLNLDLALAPVEDNLFNQCKSNLRLLEYGVLGFPVICSDVRCYQEDDLPVTRVKNRYIDWVNAIRIHLSDLDATAAMGDALQKKVREEWMLEGDNLLAWRKAWLPD